MEIEEVYPPFVYAAKYDGDKMNIYRLTMHKLTDDEYLSNFFNKFNTLISQYLINHFDIDPNETEAYAAEVNDKMIDIWEDIRDKSKKIACGEIKDFSGYFEPQSKTDIREMPDGGGKSDEYKTNYLPVKCWGYDKPSLVRIYAIELSLRCYIIIYGGIKLDKTTELSPDIDSDGKFSTLETEIKKRISEVCDYLRDNNIIDGEGLIEFLEEDD